MGERWHVPREIGVKEVGPGWGPLVNTCYAVVAAYEKIYETTLDVNQVKEKFGGLRFYVSPYFGDLEELLGILCEASFAVCEYCGAHGHRATLPGGTWIKTLCDKCANP